MVRDSVVINVNMYIYLIHVFSYSVDVLEIIPRNGVSVSRECCTSSLPVSVLGLIAQLPSNNLRQFEMLWLLYVL